MLTLDEHLPRVNYQELQAYGMLHNNVQMVKR